LGETVQQQRLEQVRAGIQASVEDEGAKAGTWFVVCYALTVLGFVLSVMAFGGEAVARFFAAVAAAAAAKNGLQEVQYEHASRRAKLSPLRNRSPQEGWKALALLAKDRTRAWTITAVGFTLVTAWMAQDSATLATPSAEPTGTGNLETSGAAATATAVSDETGIEPLLVFVILIASVICVMAGSVNLAFRRARSEPPPLQKIATAVQEVGEWLRRLRRWQRINRTYFLIWLGEWFPDALPKSKSTVAVDLKKDGHWQAYYGAMSAVSGIAMVVSVLMLAFG
jgi:hypothetical protein